MNVQDVVVTLRVDPRAVAALEDAIETAHDKIVAMHHAFMCADLVWPYWGPITKLVSILPARNSLGVEMEIE